MVPAIEPAAIVGQEPVHVFYCYSHKDERFRVQLETQLALLKRQGVIVDWHDRRIEAGRQWSKEIDRHLEMSQIILLLISADFLASDYCYQREMERALGKDRAGDACVIPIILRPVEWHAAPFSHLQALPENGKAITRWRNRDEAWTHVVRGIRVVADRMGKHPKIVDNETQITVRDAGGSLEVVLNLDTSVATPSMVIAHLINEGLISGVSMTGEPIDYRLVRDNLLLDADVPLSNSGIYSNNDVVIIRLNLQSAGSQEVTQKSEQYNGE